jgi:twitching motility protein PilT
MSEARGPLGDTNSSPSPKLDQLLALLVARRGSDLLLVSGVSACALVEGRVKSLEEGLWEGEAIESVVRPALSAHALESYRATGIADSSYRVEGLGRFRINLHQQRGKPAAAIRALPTAVPQFGELNLPPSVQNLAHLPRGLVLIGGPAGSGKSTTLAALVNEINKNESRHIVTVEDPIEYEHQHLRSIVEQVEIGTDAPAFPVALHAALRQAPDVIVIGEMRDPESMRIAVSAAETGHLVLSTIHTTDVATTIARIADSFPAERQNAVRQELALALTAVLTQLLLPSKKAGRFPAAELLMIGYGARQHIRRNALHHLHQEITLSKNRGSFSLEDSLVALIKAGHIDREDALLCATHPDDLEIMLKGDVRKEARARGTW